MANITDKNNTFADFKKWDAPDGGHYELINGEAFLKPKSSEYQLSIINKLYSQLSKFLEGKSIKAFTSPFTVRLSYKADETDDIVFQPDITIICDTKIWAAGSCHGVPDFVCEIISPTDTAVEFERKFQAYHKAGVREYWVINPGYKTLNVYNFWDDIIFPMYYGVSNTAKIGIFEDLDIKLDTIFN